MKPLELTIFPKPERPRFTYTGDHVSAMMRERKRERALIVAKRLTDAELAAEFHYAAGEADIEFFANHEQENAELNRIADTLERFATLPHYDEVDA